MSIPTKITVIGAGSAEFGENTMSAIIRSQRLKGSTLALVDRNADSLDIIQRLANRLNREWDTQFTITAHTHHEDALPDSHFVINAIEVGARENLWQRDSEIPLRYGVRQPYAENGGPGGFAHAARNIGPIMQIAHDMEQVCPDAWFVNFTNPMIRICDAVNRHTRIKVVGLCHQIYIGYTMVSVALAKDLGLEVPEGLTGMHAAMDQHPLQHRVREQIVPLVDIRAANGYGARSFWHYLKHPSNGTVMANQVCRTPSSETGVSVEEVNRVLEVGRLLLSVLTPEELEELQFLIRHFPENSSPLDLLSPSVIGNTGVT